MVMQLVEGESLLQVLVLAELDEKQRSVFKQIAAFDCGMPLLSFLDHNSNTFSTVDAIAFRLGESNRAVASTLQGLLELGLARCLQVGPTLWGLSDDPERRELVRNLVNWQKRWQARLAEVERTISGTTGKKERRNHRESEQDCPGADCSRCATYLLATVAHLQINEMEIHGDSNLGIIPGPGRRPSDQRVGPQLA